MPELPEVETTLRSFASQVANAAVVWLRLGKPLRWPLGCEPNDLIGQVIRGVRRRGKYLVLELDRGILLLHLGMSGSLRFEDLNASARVHDHFNLGTDRGVLRLNDPRRFGAAIFSESTSTGQAGKLLNGLGMEPLGDDVTTFDLHEFQRALRLRKSAIKLVLLSGHPVVGVGNIYASEALFEARINPMAPADSLKPSQVAHLRSAIVNVLNRAIDSGGSTLRNFSNATGVHGRFQNDLKVYGRKGEPCHICGGTIQMIRQGQRSTFYCSRCQRQ